MANDMRKLSWAEVHALLLPTIENEEALNYCKFDFSKVTLLDLGTDFSGANLVSEIADRYPETLKSEAGIELKWESFEQHDVNAHRLMARVTHPLLTIKKSVEKIQERWDWCKDHIAVLEPTLLTGHIHLTLKEGLVDGQCAMLPPVECLGVLRSAPLRKGDDASALVVLWYQTGFGMDPGALKQIKRLDWPALAYSWGY